MKRMTIAASANGWGPWALNELVAQTTRHEKDRSMNGTDARQRFINAKEALMIGVTEVRAPNQPRFSMVIAVAVGVFAPIFGCGHDNATARHPRPDEIPASTAIAGASLQSGLALAAHRASVPIEDFRITTRPVTRAQFKQCVDAGACRSPASTRSCLPLGSGPPDTLPQTCLVPTAAEDYCRWVGGHIATADQWQFAARGPRVQRFAWGDTPSTCAQRADAIEREPCCRSADCNQVGQHVAGASPSGVEDVLLSEAELVRGTDGSVFAACSGHQQYCLATGLGGGAIDAFIASSSPPEGKNDPEPSTSISYVPATSFRCVWSGG